MGAHRCGLSLRVFNSIANARVSAASGWDVESKTSRESPYLQATMYYFVYHINTIALWWQEKQSSSMNENKRIDKAQKQQWV